MTPDQVTKRQGVAYALIGAGIACLYAAYQYARPWVPGTEPAPDWAPYLFGGLGIAGMIAGGILWSKLKRKAPPPARTDLSGPEGKKVIVLMVIGFGALASTWLTDYVIPAGNDILDAGVSVVLLLIAIVCLFSAARIGKRIRQASAIGATHD